MPFNQEAEARRDEMTGAAERLSLPMQHSFVYKREKGQLFSEFGLSLDDVVGGGLDDIKLAVKFHPDWQGEVRRRELDRQELEAVKALRPGEKQVTFLPIPDDVRAGTTTIGGYDRDRLRMLVRVAEARPDDQVTITSFSLERSYYPGLQAAAHALGHIIPEGLSSDEITASRIRLPGGSGSSDELVQKIRTAYDKQLSRDLGGEWFAGRKPITPNNALAFVESQKGLFEEHMRAVGHIQAEFFGFELNARLEQARYNFAARLDGLLQGKQYASAESAGSEARARGQSFDGDCPPSLSTLSQAEKLGFDRQAWQVGETRKCVGCPICGKVVSATKLETGILCHKCHKELKSNGEVKDHNSVETVIAKTALAQTMTASKNIMKIPGVVVKTKIIFGGATKQAYDQQGNLIAEGRAAEKLQV